MSACKASYRIKRSGPNSPDNYGNTPIHGAIRGGHTEIVKTLVPFITKNDDLNKLIFIAKTEEIRKILKSFKTSRRQDQEYRNHSSLYEITLPIHKILKTFYSVKKITNNIKLCFLCPNCDLISQTIE